MESPVILKTFHNGKIKEYFVIPEGELHTEFGVIRLDELKTRSSGDTICSHLGFKFTIQKPRNPDFFHHAKRSGAPMMPRDIGTIIANTGLCSSDTVLEAGTGSGILSIYLGGIAKKVISYEIKQEFIDIAQKNIALAGLSNVELRLGDIISEIRTLDEIFDVIVLDMKDAAQVVPHVPRVIYPGGFLAVYSPFFEQTKEIRGSIERTDYTGVRTVENIEREISFTDRGTRPATTRVGHTGFITIVRY